MANIQVTHNGKAYFVNKLDTLKSMLSREELLQLPMSAWIEILKLKDGRYYLKTLITILTALIKTYDKSSKVNSFYYNGKEYWLDKNTRMGLMNLAKCNPSSFNIVLDDTIVTTSADKAVEFLSQLEIYAGECYVNTAKHLLTIKDLKTVEDVINYDYTSGYPDKITLNE